MSEKEDIQRRVRQRAHFTCEAEESGQLVLAQYAHIVPESERGKYEVNNILWLCEHCHRRHETADKEGPLKGALQQKMLKMRDTPKIDGLISGVFDELVTSDDVPITVFMGNVEFESTGTIFSEPEYGYKPSYIRLTKDGDQLILEGLLKNDDGEPLVTFKGTYLMLHTKDFWDIERRSGYLKIYSKSKNIWLELRQNSDLALTIEGRIFVAGKIMTMSTEDGIKLPGLLNLSRMKISSVSQGFRIPPSPHIYPIGHSKAHINPSLGSGILP
jgi:hypothetical protein